MPLKQPPFILSLLRLYCCSASSLTYSYIRPSTYNWNIKSSSHSTILLQQQQPFLPPPLSTQPLTSSSSSFHLKASFVYWGHYYTELRELRNPPLFLLFQPITLCIYRVIYWFYYPSFHFHVEFSRPFLTGLFTFQLISAVSVSPTKISGTWENGREISSVSK